MTHYETTATEIAEIGLDDNARLTVYNNGWIAIDSMPNRVELSPAAAVALSEHIRAPRLERIVVASADGARTWIGGDKLADLLETVNGFLADGYTPEELIIEGITR